MKRGLRYLPTSPRGRTRATAFALGLLAALSLFWQQQTTLAAFVDTEYGQGTFTADTLKAIKPSLTPSYSKIVASWDPASGDWATPQYTLNWSTDSGGLSATELYSGTGAAATLQTGTGTQSNQALLFTDVAAGATHACGIAHGSVYCWGASASGALGLGSTGLTATTPTRITSGAIGSETVVQVTAGTNFTCARTSSGNAYCWGLASSYQLGNGSTTNQYIPVAVSGLTNVTSISAGTLHACAVSSGKAYCWGSNAYGQLGNNTYNTNYTPGAVASGQPFAARTVSQISAGDRHTCAVADGRAFCWGNNASGRLGDNSVTARTLPVAVYVGTLLAGRQVTEVSAGYAHSCAVADKQAFCWGINTNGFLGNNSTTASQIPVPVTTTVMNGSVTAISAGYAHTCAVANGAAYCWGLGTSGQLGNAASATSLVPVKVAGTLTGRTVTTISAGTNFACANGNTPVGCWGLGTSYQLGNASNITKNLGVDVSLSGPECPVGSVRVGSSCTLVEGTAYYFQLGYSIGGWTAPNSSWTKGTTTTRSGLDPTLSSHTATTITATWDAAPDFQDSYPEYTVSRSTNSGGSNPQTVTITPGLSATDSGGVPTTRTWSQVSVGTNHACAILDGSVYCWGLNTNGQLGVGDTTERAEPTKVTLPGTATKVSAGAAHTCAVSGGAAYCWGINTYGQLGNNSTAQSTTPVSVANQSGFTVLDVSAGTDHSCAVTQGGQSWCWGRNNYGQLGNNSTTNSSVPVGPLAGAIPAGTVTQISAGLTHSCAVANGQAYCWGRGNYGQLGFNSTQSNLPAAVLTTYGLGAQVVSEVSAGSNHSCAIAAAKAYCWGYDNYGQVGNGATVPAATYATQAVVTTTMTGSVTSISAGISTTCATAAGKIYCWGLGTSGQLGNRASTNQTSPVAAMSQAALAGDTATDSATGSTHSCGIADGALYCWGISTNGRLGNRDTSTSIILFPQPAAPDVMCSTGATGIGDGTCTLAPSTTYYYRVSYTLDGDSAKAGSWVGLSTSS